MTETKPCTFCGIFESCGMCNGTGILKKEFLPCFGCEIWIPSNLSKDEANKQAMKSFYNIKNHLKTSS